jgi:hypothetical protein
MGMVEWEEPGCLARGTVRRFDLDQHRAAKGLPPTGVRGLLQDRSPPHICDASRARPRRAGMSTGRAQMIHSVKNKVRTYAWIGCFCSVSHETVSHATLGHEKA